MLKPTLDFVNSITLNAGEILKNYTREALNITRKGHRDLVTQADRDSERYLIDAIQTAFPGHAIVTEEAGKLDGQQAHQWFIDPLDGTLNYAHGVPFYSVSVGYAFEGEVVLGAVYDPLRDELFSAALGQGATLNGKPIRVSEITKLADCMLVTGFPNEVKAPIDDNVANFMRLNSLAQTVRRLGSAALDGVYIAAGRIDGYWETEINQWDIAASGLIVREAGGLVTDIFGDPDYMKTPPTFLCANPAIHQQMLAVLAEVRAAVNPQ